MEFIHVRLKIWFDKFIYSESRVFGYVYYIYARKRGIIVLQRDVLSTWEMRKEFVACLSVLYERRRSILTEKVNHLKTA